MFYLYTVDEQTKLNLANIRIIIIYKLNYDILSMLQLYLELIDSEKLWTCKRSRNQ